MMAIILLFYNLTKSQIVRETFTNQHFSNERVETPYKSEMISETSEKMMPTINNPLMNILLRKSYCLFFLKDNLVFQNHLFYL